MYNYIVLFISDILFVKSKYRVVITSNNIIKAGYQIEMSSRAGSL